MIAALDQKIDSIMQTHFPEIRTDIALLKNTAGWWGAVGGLLIGWIPSVIMILIKLHSM